MKIGVITFHRPINYGAIFQSVALIKKLSSLKIDAEIIDYRNKRHEKEIANMSFKSASGYKNKIKSLLFYRFNNRKKEKFCEFLNNNAKVSEVIYDKNNIKDINKEYTHFITGSDQVWNLNLTDSDYNYFLDFVNDDSKKFSYASSFGYSKVPEQYVSKTKEYLSKYKKISVREAQGAKIINDLIDKKVDVVLDPTLLLNKDEWLELAENVKFKLPEKYILLYVVSPTKEDFLIAKKFSKMVNMKVILINYNMKYVFGMKNCFDLGPGEFLNLFKNATYVLTNSFHGTAFSINFNKNFYVRLSKKANNGNSRIENIINLVGLQDRYIDEECDVDISNIDFEKVNKIMESERKKSVDVLYDFVK